MSVTARYQPVDRTVYYRSALGQTPIDVPGHLVSDRAPADVPVVPRSVTGGRATGSLTEPRNGLFGWQVVPRRQYVRVDASRLDLSRLAPYQVMELLGDMSPDVSMALWNNLLMTNSGYTFEVLDAAGNPDDAGYALLMALVGRLNARAGGLDGIIDQWHYTAYLQGAMAGEIVLTPNLQDIEDIYPVSPWTIEFTPAIPRPVPRQQLPWESQPRRLNLETFWYLPLMPAVDDPYGRMPFASVVHALNFDMQLLHDLQVAVHANAWDRLDITILESAILSTAPEHARVNPVERARWVESTVNMVRQAFDGLRPDDHIIHTDGTSVKPVNSGNRSVGIVPVFRMLERRIIRGLKQLPILMGSNESTTETHGTIQFEIWVDGISAVQQRTRDMLEGMLTLAMQVYGRQSHVVMRWNPIRTSDRYKDAQAEELEIKNALNKRDAGWITNNDAAMEITGGLPDEGAEAVLQAPGSGLWRAGGGRAGGIGNANSGVDGSDDASA